MALSRTGMVNVWLLMLSASLAFSALPLMLLVGSLVGERLAPSAEWSTLPLALVILGTAVGILPATHGMQRFGRKPVFMVFIAFGILACWIASYSVAQNRFGLFCFSAALLGVTNAALQQIRFAAMECVGPEQGPTAASIILSGGIVAAIVGPELAVFGRHITLAEYQGSFWLISICLILAACVLALYQPVKPSHAEVDHAPRPVLLMLKNPGLLLAITSGAVGYVVMAFIMTGTPISMHQHHGHSLVDTKWVIQSHIIAMFLPSLISPWLFRWLDIKGMMMAGLLCYCTTIIVGLIDSSVMGYWGQLVMLGIGWNFLFVSGTALLPSTHLEGEHYRAQALNDGIVFSTQALAALSAGWALNAISWQAILLLCLIPMALMVMVLVRWRPVKAKPIGV